MYYRIVDLVGEPYCVWYNEKSLEWLAESLYILGSDFWDDEWITEKRILEYLKNGEYDFWWYYVESQNEPFEDFEKIWL